MKTISIILFILLNSIVSIVLSQSSDFKILFPSKHSGKINNIAFSKDNRYFLTASQDNSVKIWETVSGACVVNYTQHSGGVSKAIFIESILYDQLLVATAGTDNSTHVFEALTGKTIFKFEDHSRSVIDVDYNENYKSIITTSLDNNIFEYDLQKGKLINKVKIYAPFGSNTFVFRNVQNKMNANIYYNIRMDDGLLTLINGKETLPSLMFKSRGQTNEMLMSDDVKYLVMANKLSELAIYSNEKGVQNIVLDSYHNSRLFDSNNYLFDFDFVNESTVVVLMNNGIYEVNLINEKVNSVLDISIESGFITENNFVVKTSGMHQQILIQISRNNLQLDTLYQSDEYFRLNQDKESKTAYCITSNKIIMFNEKSFIVHEICDYSQSINDSVFMFSNYTLNLVNLKTGKHLYEITDHKNNLWKSLDTLLLNKFLSPEYIPSNDNASITLMGKYLYPIQSILANEGYVCTIANDAKNYLFIGHPLHNGLIWKMTNEKPQLVFQIENENSLLGRSISPDEFVKNNFIHNFQTRNQACFSKDNKYCYITGIDKNVYQYNLIKNDLKILSGHHSTPLFANLSMSNQMLVTGGFDNQVIVWNTSTGKIIYRLDGHSDDVVFGAFIDDDSRLITYGKDKKHTIWDLSTGKKIADIIYTNNLFTIIAGTYFMSEGNGATKIFYFEKNQVYPFEQFDLKYNRPDIILDRLGYADSSLVAAYHQAYLKRLKKMGFTEEMLQDDFHLPEIKIENFEEIPSIDDDGKLDLKLKLFDTKYPLDRINVWVNDVAIYGKDGISLRDKNLQEYATTLSVALAKGKNKIQVSVLNKAGAESYKQTVEVNCTHGKDQSDLYILTVGVSNYNDSRYNLSYAAKDANDLVTAFKTNKYFENVYSKTLTDNQVTLENISNLKSFFANADINDQVIVFIAGHGVLDADFDYYFASYDMDFANPSARGIPYELIESLLDGIKPLKKLLFMDTCHSGEVDKDEIQVSDKNNESESDVVFRNVGVAIENKESHLGLQNTSELTKSLFTDLRKGTGATVISSAGGVEFAMESDQWKNGLFTYCLIQGLTTNAADYNNDRTITVSEIQTYVQQKVTKLSNGKQTPTSRIENQTLDYRVW